MSSQAGAGAGVVVGHGDRVLSVANPLATADQRFVEDLALRIVARPDFSKAREAVSLLWRSAAAYPLRDEMARFEGMIDEYMFHYALRAANSDPSHPRIVRFMAPPHRWFGRDVPGSRWAGDSPDFIYRITPVEPGGRYEIHGQATCDDPPTVNYQLLGTRSAPIPMGILDSLDMVINADGSFVITIDDQPADGRRNHIQLRPGADHIMIRDALGDWQAQTPNALRILRLSAPSFAPLSEDEAARRAAQKALDAVYYSYYMTQSGSDRPPNTIRPPMSSATFGGMPSQWGAKATLMLERDEALIVRANAAGAQFRNVVLCDAFFLSLNYWSRTASLNMRQMAADADGDFTYVVAHQDPGVHNWLDANGVRRLLFGQRWQAVARDYTGPKPQMSVQLVKLSALDGALPTGVRSIDSAGRRQQTANRLAGFQKRFVDQ